MSLLLSVVIIGALSLLAVKSLAILSLGSLSSANLEEQGRKAQVLAINCLEEGLRRLMEDSEWRSNGFDIDFSEGSCQGSVGGGNTIELSATGTISGLNFRVNRKYNINNGQIVRLYD